MNNWIAKQSWYKVAPIFKRLELDGFFFFYSSAAASRISSFFWNAVNKRIVYIYIYIWISRRPWGRILSKNNLAVNFSRFIFTRMNNTMGLKLYLWSFYPTSYDLFFSSNARVRGMDTLECVSWRGRHKLSRAYMWSGCHYSISTVSNGEEMWTRNPETYTVMR